MKRHREGTSVRAIVALAGALVLAACGAQDSQAPNSDPSLVSLTPGQSAQVVGATTLRVQAWVTGQRARGVDVSVEILD